MNALLIVSLALGLAPADHKAEATAALALAKAARMRETAPAAVPAPPVSIARLTYAELHRRVTAGESLMVAAGVEPQRDDEIRAERIPGEAPGIYWCFLEHDQPAFQRAWHDLPVKHTAKAVKPASGVAGKTFPDGAHHAGHNCPNCGREQLYVASGKPNISGHTHKCPACGTSWWH